MNYFEKYEAQDQKLENILADKHLLHQFNPNTYPMCLTISQNQDLDEQMQMYSDDTMGVSSKDAKLVLLFPIGGKADIVVRVYGKRLVISNGLMNKIKDRGLKMRDFYLQAYHARRMEDVTKQPQNEEAPLEEDSDREDENESEGEEA